MDPDKSADEFPLTIPLENRIGMLEQVLGRLENASHSPAATSRPLEVVVMPTRRRWRREHTVLLAAAACGVATSSAYALFMLTGISPLDAGDLGDEARAPQSMRQLLAVGEIAVLALLGTWATWMVVRRG